MAAPPDDGGVPAAEGPWARRTTHVVTVLAFAATLAYLSWRVAATLDWSVWWVSVPLVLLEVHAAASLALFAFSAWDPFTVTGPAVPALPTGKVAIFIPTYNEAIEVLLPTIAAAVALQPHHETWVLDDGDRADLAALADALGARYLTRPTHEHAKAGNINHALGVVDADFIAVLDADHVALPGLLLRTLPYFDDPRMAVVQTPQDFYNEGSFEHERRRWSGHRARLFNEQELFYRVIQPGKNRWGAAFWCGTNAVVRTAALRDVGGVATESVTEDIHTTIRIHRHGWRSVYHNEVLARGLAAADSAQYAAQRVRWGTGAMEVLRREHPLVVRGLTAPSGCPTRRRCSGGSTRGATSVTSWYRRLCSSPERSPSGRPATPSSSPSPSRSSCSGSPSNASPAAGPRRSCPRCSSSCAWSPTCGRH